MHSLSVEAEVAVKREIRTLLIFAAAASSVVAVPLIAALVAHLSAAEIAVTVSVTAAAVGAIATLIFSAYSRRQNSADQAIIEYERDRLATLAEILKALPPRAVLREHGEGPIEVMILPPAPAERSRLTPEVQILAELADIEGEARALLGEGSSASIIRIRSRLRDSGVWSEEDVYDFDTALRVRNKVAHGDQEELTKTSLAEALEIMKRLRRKLETSRLAPPSN
jgi:hypothetical protein